MNQQSQVATKWHREFPVLSSKQWASWKIFLGCFVLFNFSLQLGMHLGNPYPTAAQRGNTPQAAHNKPLIIAPFEVQSNFAGERAIRSYAIANVDDYALKTNIFSNNKMI